MPVNFGLNTFPCQSVRPTYRFPRFPQDPNRRFLRELVRAADFKQAHWKSAPWNRG